MESSATLFEVVLPVSYLLEPDVVVGVDMNSGVACCTFDLRVVGREGVFRIQESVEGVWKSERVTIRILWESVLRNRASEIVDYVKESLYNGQTSAMQVGVAPNEELEISDLRGEYVVRLQ